MKNKIIGKRKTSKSMAGYLRKYAGKKGRKDILKNLRDKKDRF